MLQDYPVLQLFNSKGLLKIVSQELDVNLEIPHIAYIEIKQPNPKVLLFVNPVDRELGIKYDIPVIMNIFASKELIQLAMTRGIGEVINEIEKFLKYRPPSNFSGKLNMLKDLFSLRNVFPNKQEKKNVRDTHKLFSGTLRDLPILKTWSEDGGKFITMGQVYTHSLDGQDVNVGMYRLQVHDDNTLGMHWQVHKDSAQFFQEYKKANKSMPVTVVIGGDPLYTWIATAPMPHGMNELLLYGFITGKSPKLINVNSNYVPEDGDIIIEGVVNTNELKVEGPFGDHTGYYTLKEEYPAMSVSNIWTKPKPLYYATVVGKPPIEDKYMGWATERIFLPLLKTTAHDLIDYSMPENGVFHNLIIGKMNVKYTGHAIQFMHAFWGVGQMSFVKHAIFVDENAPDLRDIDTLIPHILNRISFDKIMVSSGVLDALDHSSPQPLVGGKLGIDATGDEARILKLNIVSDDYLLKRMKVDCNGCAVHIVDVKQYFTNTLNPITFLTVQKKSGLRGTMPIFEDYYREHIRILVLIDEERNQIDNSYMLLWRVLNNIDAKRDIYMSRNFYVVDATNKSKEYDDFEREWPGDVLCDEAVLKGLEQKGLISISNEFIKKFGLL
jgi:4-hydroxy-3-polyprenylbenzoate decarboxylase